MINVFIPDIDVEKLEKKLLFIVTRPFLDGNRWANLAANRKRWDLSDEWVYVSAIQDAHIVFIPLPINTYVEKEMLKELANIDQQCKKLGIRALAYVSGDFGIRYPEFPNIDYYRMGGFKRQLGINNYGFPVAISDRFNGVFRLKKNENPVIGFCGHATTSLRKAILETSKFVRENFRRFLLNPMRKDWEPLFPSAYHRAQLLQSFEKSDLINPNFIYRNKYRAGVKTSEDRDRTTQEYFQNIEESDYIMCIRGGGNFSVRLYETLMMGRIPILIDTDCLMPFEDEIDWKKHVVWVDWKDRHRIVQRVTEFHRNLPQEEFIELQKNNRKIWQEKLSVNGIFEFIKRGLI